MPIAPVLKIENKGPDVAIKRLAILMIQEERLWYVNNPDMISGEFDYQLIARQCIARAKYSFQLINKRRMELVSLIVGQAPVSDELMQWALMPVTRYTKGKTWTR